MWRCAARWPRVCALGPRCGGRPCPGAVERRKCKRRECSRGEYKGNTGGGERRRGEGGAGGRRGEGITDRKRADGVAERRRAGKQGRDAAVEEQPGQSAVIG